MKKYQKEIIKLTAKEVLSSIFDLAEPFFEASRIYRVSAKQYRREREQERSDYIDRIYYLKKMGFIETFVEGKEKFIELTPKGLDKIRKMKDDDISITRPDIWDSKWRVVIFDIPNRKRMARDLLRFRLIRLGFEKIQESVYVYPFECTGIITEVVGRLSVAQYVLIMVSEIIQGEQEIIAKFLDKNVLHKTDLIN